MGYVVEEVTSTPVASVSRVYDRPEDVPEDVRRALREAGLGDLADAAGNPRASVRITGMENLRPEDLARVRRSLRDLPEPMRKLVEDELRRGMRAAGDDGADAR
jgi:hypothetical protein